jgi:hypothetical protein
MFINWQSFRTVPSAHVYAIAQLGSFSGSKIEFLMQ